MKHYLTILALTITASLSAQTETVVYDLAPQQLDDITYIIEPRQTYPFKSLVNLFIQQHASQNLEWQKEIELISKPGEIPFKYTGKSPLLGYYAFSAVTYDELSALQKEAVLKDSRFLPWLEWFSGKHRLMSRTHSTDIEIKEDVTAKPGLKEEVTTQSEPVLLDSIELKYQYNIPESQIISTQPLHLKLDKSE